MNAIQDIMPKLQEKISNKSEELRTTIVKLNFEDITHPHMHKSVFEIASKSWLKIDLELLNEFVRTTVRTEMRFYSVFYSNCCFGY